jgi:hypothetical protein
VEFKLKSISSAGIPEAISKAELYRSLNEPEEAESICHDILAVEPEHQIAIRILGLAITDQFCGDASDRVAEAQELFQRLAERYEQLYYTGLMHERRAKAQMRLGRAGHTLAPLFGEAMRCFGLRETTMPFFAGIVAPGCCKAIPASWKSGIQKRSTLLTARQSEPAGQFGRSLAAVPAISPQTEALGQSSVNASY